MVQTAITEAITTLAEAEDRFHLQRTEEAGFFSEWQTNLTTLEPSEKAALDDLRRRYLYHRSEGNLLEGTVTLLVASPLLTIAGFYDPPFRVRTEKSVLLTLDDSEEVLRGRIDVLVLQEQFWVVVVESKKTTISAWAALPQALAYMMANPHPEKPGYGLVTNGDDILFVKLKRNGSTLYDVSRVFALFTSGRELYGVLQVLKRIAGEIAGVGG
jgi:hypothetical protein